MTVVERNKKYARFYGVLSILLNIGPIVFYAAKAYSEAVDKPMGRYILTSILSVTVIMCLVAVVIKRMPRCTVWLLLIGLYMCLDGILPCMIVLASTQFLDEIVVSPLRKRYAARLLASQEAKKIFEELTDARAE